MPTRPFALARAIALLGGTTLLAPSCADVLGLDAMELKPAADASVEAGAHGGAGGSPSDASQELDAVKETSAEAQAEAKADTEAGEPDVQLEAEAEAGCAPGHKPCDDQCVPKNQTSTGCGAAACDPCQVPHGTPICDANLACALGACDADFDDCNGDASDGCEAGLKTDAEHCGGCQHGCPQDFTCEAGVCACASDPSCNAGSDGVCDAGTCVCGNTTCAAGERCQANGQCG